MVEIGVVGVAVDVGVIVGVFDVLTAGVTVYKVQMMLMAN